jgi:DNA-binding GntR family transcriptional regulator
VDWHAGGEEWTVISDIVSPNYFAGRQSLSQEVVELIKRLITDGILNPGERIIESQLARQLGVSLTPVREAIRLLAGEGIVVIVPNKGALVRELTRQDIFEIYSMRAVLEGMAIRLATELASMDELHALEQHYEQMRAKIHDDTVESLLADATHIHETIVRCSRHTRLIGVYQTLTFQIALVNRSLGTKSTKQQEVDRHADVIVALAHRDPDYAERLMREHIYQAYRLYTQLASEVQPALAAPLWF